MNKSQIKAVEKYKKNNYERLEIYIPKGEKDYIKQYAKKNNISVNYLYNIFTKGIVKMAFYNNIEINMNKDNYIIYKDILKKISDEILQKYLIYSKKNPKEKDIMEDIKSIFRINNIIRTKPYTDNDWQEIYNQLTEFDIALIKKELFK